jgi:hypothetical protein
VLVRVLVRVRVFVLVLVLMLMLVFVLVLGIVIVLVLPQHHPAPPAPPHYTGTYRTGSTIYFKIKIIYSTFFLFYFVFPGASFPLGLSGHL